MKIGIEVEGRLSGIKTLFVSAEEFSEITANQKLSNLYVEHGFTQLYISDHLNVLKLTSTIFEELADHFIITVEVTEVAEYSDYVNIMLAIESKSFWNLRKTDQIKFSDDMHVYSATIENMYYTTPDEFEGDVTL
jgi:hypothetical protein